MQQHWPGLRVAPVLPKFCREENKAMSNNEDWYVVTHRVTAERVTPKEEGLSYAGWVGVVAVIIVLLGILGHFVNPCP
jgi:hypothetical protein